MRQLRTVGAVLVTGLLLAACSGGDDGAAESADAPASAQLESIGDAEEPEVAEDSADGEGEGDDTASSGTITGAARIDPSPRHVIYNVDLVIETDDVARAAARAAALADTTGGFVANETTEGSESATLTLRVPSAQHTGVVDDLEALGDVQHRSRSADDVTSEVVDVDARVASQRRSIERIRELLDRASDLSDVVRIESELADREANLDSLLRRQEQLASLTTLATVTVTFHETDAAADNGPDALGFLSGLRSGWDAFVAAVRVAGAIAGALVPFASAAALVGIPAWLVWRRRRSGSAGPAEPPSPAPAQPAPQPEG